eukprot:g29882.t1
MAMFNQQVGLQGLLKDGGKHFSGVDEALLKNIEACKNLAQITKSSLGPYGMNKLIVNHLGRHFVTSDTNTIVTELEVMHPAAKLIVMAAKLTKCVKTAISSKQLGCEGPLAKLVAEACVQVMPPTPSKFDVDNVRVTKVQGGNLNSSFVVEGMAIARRSSGVENCKEKAKASETKGTVLLESAEQLMNFSKGEEQKMEEMIRAIKEVGVDVVISGGTISDMALHFLNKYKIFALKINSKFELRRVCRTVGATSIVRSGPPLPEECGYVESIKVEEISSEPFTIIKTRDSKISTVVLRSASPNVLDELERAIDNAVNVVRCTARDPRFVAGAGATEIELAHQLQQFGATALEVVPKILAENAGHSHVDAITALYAAHQKGETAAGIDVDAGPVCNALEKGILDHMETKRWAIRFTLDAVLTVLKVDQIIMAKQAGGKSHEKPHPNRRYWKLRSGRARAVPRLVRWARENRAEKHGFDRAWMRELLTNGSMPIRLVGQLPSAIFSGKLVRNRFLSVCSRKFQHGLPPRFYMLLALQLDILDFEKDQMVYHCHDQAFSIYLVLKGVFASVALPSPEGGVIEWPGGASASGLGDTSEASLQQDKLQRLLKDFPDCLSAWLTQARRHAQKRSTKLRTLTTPMDIMDLAKRDIQLAVVNVWQRKGTSSSRSLDGDRPPIVASRSNGSEVQLKSEVTGSVTAADSTEALQAEVKQMKGQMKEMNRSWA